MTTTAPAATPAALPKAAADRQPSVLRSLLRNRLAALALGFLVLIVVCAVFAPLIAPADPATQNLLGRLQPPAWQSGGSSAHLLGTDQLGRDLLSRVIYGTRVSLLVGAGAALLAGVIGTVAGLASGYLGGWTDRIVMRVADVQLAFPAILLALAVVGFVGSGLGYVIVVLGITGWVSYARVVRSEVLSLRTRDFVTEARAIGVGDLAIMRRHLLPNVMAPLATIGTLHIAAAIVAEASLSYLGLGVPKETVTWGGMLSDGQLYLGTSWWIAVFPGIALMLTSLAINILGDALRDVADPEGVPPMTDNDTTAPDTGAPVLEFRDLHVDFALASSTVHAVRGVSFAVRAGETLAVVGESGSGKSATALSAMRLNPEPPCVYAGGQVLLDGRDVLALRERELRTVRGAEISMVFQDPMTSLDPLQRVGAQVAEVLRLHGGRSRAEARQAALTALEEVGIPDPERRYGQYPHELSGGLRQRVMIASALVARPRVLIADEPTTALDVTVQRQILELLVSLQRRHGMAVVLITHDLGVVAETADRVVVMRHGEVVESGDVEQVFHRPAAAYTRDLLAATPRLEPVA